MAEFLLGVMLCFSVTLQSHFHLMQLPSTSIVQLSHVHRLPIIRSSAKETDRDKQRQTETGGIDWSVRLTANERLAPLLCSSPPVLRLVGCPLGAVVQVMVDLDQVMAGMDVDVAA